MFHKILGFAAVVILITAGHAHAQSRVELFGGYSFVHGPETIPLGPTQDMLNGWNVSVAAKVIPHLQAAADVGGYYASSPGIPCSPITKSCGPFSSHIYDALFGPQVSVSVGQLRPFAHALFGVGHLSMTGSSFSSLSDTEYANALGGGVDYWLTHRAGLRVQADYFANRFFFGYRPNTPYANLRFSTGIVFRPRR